MATLADLTFDELADENARYIHSALLEGGGKTMKSAVHAAMCTTLRWRVEHDEKLAHDLEVEKSKQNKPTARGKRHTI